MNVSIFLTLRSFALQQVLCFFIESVEYECLIRLSENATLFGFDKTL
jgi:hypothetical protein